MIVRCNQEGEYWNPSIKGKGEKRDTSSHAATVSQQRKSRIRDGNSQCGKHKTIYPYYRGYERKMQDGQD